MTIILDIFKFIVILVYLFFFLDSMLNFKYEFLDKKSKDSSWLDMVYNLSWLDVVYLIYAGVNLILIVKVLHGLK